MHWPRLRRRVGQGEQTRVRAPACPKLGLSRPRSPLESKPLANRTEAKTRSPHSAPAGVPASASRVQQYGFSNTCNSGSCKRKFSNTCNKQKVDSPYVGSTNMPKVQVEGPMKNALAPNQASCEQMPNSPACPSIQLGFRHLRLLLLQELHRNFVRLHAIRWGPSQTWAVLKKRLPSLHCYFGIPHFMKSEARFATLGAFVCSAAPVLS